MISKLSGSPAVVFDKDHVVAVSGVPKKEYAQRRVSTALEELMEQRKAFEYNSDDDEVRPIEGLDSHALAVSPIITNGDISGAVAIVSNDESEKCSALQAMLCKAGAMFLGKQIEE